MNYTGNATTIIQFLVLFNTYTQGTGWIIINFVIGIIIFLTLKANDINDGLMISTFMMALLSFILNFIGLINAYFVGIHMGLFILSMVFKLVFKEGN